MTNKILRFLFGWIYDFDVSKNNDNKMTDRESKRMMKDFGKLGFKNKSGKREWFIKNGK